MIGVESSHGFGDCCFNSPLIEALSQKYTSKVDVAVKYHCADAFVGHPSVGRIVPIHNMWEGIAKFQSEGYTHVFQLTQNIKFFEFREHDPNHSLIDTPLLTGRQLGVEFNQRPVIYLTDKEVAASNNLKPNRPTIAIESVYTSGQSWATDTAISAIIEKYQSTHHILWLSNTKPPDGVEMPHVSRRVLIASLRYCDKLFSVGSGFFCATMALPQAMQPKEVICLWIDDFYKYERRINEARWHCKIDWIHNEFELLAYLCN